MTEFLVQLRQEKGVLQNISVGPQINLQQLKQLIGNTTGMQTNQFEIYSQGQLLDGTQNKTTIRQMGIQTNSIIDITKRPSSSNELNIIVECGADRARMHVYKQQTIRSVKSRIAQLFDFDSEQFQISTRDQQIIQQNKTIDDFGIVNDQIISVKLKLPLNSLNTLGNIGLTLNTSKVRMVQSVASSSDNHDEKDQSPFLLKKNKFSIHKKSSCSASLHNIKDQQQQPQNKLKSSSIEPYTMHKNAIDQVQQKQNKLTRIEDIKETMSFGSLQQAKCQQTQIEIISQDSTIFYRLTCPLGCRGLDVKRRLARAGRLNIENLKIGEIKDQDLIQNLNQTLDTIRAIYTVNE